MKAAPHLHRHAYTLARTHTIPPRRAPRRPCPQLALKLAAAGVQKHPESQMMRALKAVGLERTGKMEEALKVGRSGAVAVHTAKMAAQIAMAAQKARQAGL